MAAAAAAAADERDAPSLVVSCIRRAEAMLARDGEGAGSAGAGVVRPGLAGMLHVLLLLATGATEAQRGALVTSGFHLKLVELFKSTMAALRRQRRDAKRRTPSPLPPSEEWPEYMAPCLLLLDLVAKPSASPSQVAERDPQVASLSELHRQHRLAAAMRQRTPLGEQQMQQQQQQQRPAQQLSMPAPPPPPPPPPGSSSTAPGGARQSGDSDGGSGSGGVGSSVLHPSPLRSEVRVSGARAGDAGGSADGDGGGRGGGEGGHASETVSSSSTSPTEGGPPALAESKESAEGDVMEGAKGIRQSSVVSGARTRRIARKAVASSKDEQDENPGGGGAQGQEAEGGTPLLAESKGSSDGGAGGLRRRRPAQAEKSAGRGAQGAVAEEEETKGAPADQAEAKTPSAGSSSAPQQAVTTGTGTGTGTSAEGGGNASTDGSISATAAAAAAPSPDSPPTLHVLLSAELMAELVEAFIEFFAGVAVPPPVGDVTRATAAEVSAAEAAAEAGAALPAPSPSLVFAALQLLARLVRDYGRAERF
ncbi:unnamed protein product, partial [Scytosiphon promiscuus]